MVNKNNKINKVYKQLSILISQDGFFFYLHHSETEYSKDLESILVKDVLDVKSLKIFQKQLKQISHHYDFKSIKVAFANSYYTLVPKDYYKEELKSDYLKYNVQLFEEDHISSDYIQEIDVYHIYIPLMNYHNVILDLVDEFEYHHFTNNLIKYSKPKIFDVQQRLHVFMTKSSLDIVAFEGQKFRLCNSFAYETDYDLAYYILFAIEELKFDQRKMQLNITHNFEETPWLDILKIYILNVNCEQKALASFVK